MSLGAASPLMDLVRPGGLHLLGSADNVWLSALGLAVVSPALANIAPRLMRPLGVLGAMAAMATAFVATYRQETVLALALITFAVTCGFLAAWSAGTLRTTIGPIRGRRLPRQRIVQGLVLRGAASRAFDRL